MLVAHWLVLRGGPRNVGNSGLRLSGLMCPLGPPDHSIAPTPWWFFFFQAEDGIRDLTVTGVQTCALPIWRRGRRGGCAPASDLPAGERGQAVGRGRAGRRLAGRGEGLGLVATEALTEQWPDRKSVV